MLPLSRGDFHPGFFRFFCEGIVMAKAKAKQEVRPDKHTLFVTKPTMAGTYQYTDGTGDVGIVVLHSYDIPQAPPGAYLRVGGLPVGGFVRLKNRKLRDADENDVGKPILFSNALSDEFVPGILEAMSQRDVTNKYFVIAQSNGVTSATTAKYAKVDLGPIDPTLDDEEETFEDVEESMKEMALPVLDAATTYRFGEVVEAKRFKNWWVPCYFQRAIPGKDGEWLAYVTVAGDYNIVSLTDVRPATREVNHDEFVSPCGYRYINSREDCGCPFCELQLKNDEEKNLFDSVTAQLGRPSRTQM
jgi:hypothetical protein